MSEYCYGMREHFFAAGDSRKAEEIHSFLKNYELFKIKQSREILLSPVMPSSFSKLLYAAGVYLCR